MGSSDRLPGKGKTAQQDRSFEVSTTKIPVAEEHLHITKQVVQTGKVRVSKKVLEEEYNEQVPVFKEEIIVERKQINQFVDGDAPGIRLAGETTIIPVLKEVIVKRLLLVEELHITKKTSEQSIQVRETVRREEVSVTRSDISPDNRNTHS
jgi:uncharacterized protein (TIGR02271 family)